MPISPCVILPAVTLAKPPELCKLRLHGRLHSADGGRRRGRGRGELLRQLGAEMLAACFVIDLPDLGGAERLRKLDVPVRTLISFGGH